MPVRWSSGLTSRGGAAPSGWARGSDTRQRTAARSPWLS
jgi:hypothetical protein